MEREAFEKLTRKAKVCGSQHHQSVPDTSKFTIAIADKDQRLLSKSEVQNLCARSGIRAELVQLVIERASDYVDQSKQVLMSAQPSLFTEGGALYPAERAQACWRDCWNFLRVATYAAATNTAECTDPQGIKAVSALYDLLGVPLEGMTVALATLSDLITSDINKQEGNHDKEALCFKATFDHLNRALHKG